MAFFKKFRDAQRPCCAALVAAAGVSVVLIALVNTGAS